MVIHTSRACQVYPTLHFKTQIRQPLLIFPTS